MSKVILVTGATGRQGGAVITALLQAPEANGIRIAALTRNVESPSAKKLADKSSRIQLVKGNLDDADAIFRDAAAHIGSIWGVFSVQLAIGNGASPESEERQGKALVDAAIKAGVQFFVYTSVDRAGDKSDDNPTYVPHFKSKHEIERHLRARTSNETMNWTILRPVMFMDPLKPDYQGKLLATAVKTFVKEKRLQFVAIRDIGIMATKAFTHPEAYKGRCISLAGDELSYGEMNDIFRRKFGKDLPTTYSIFAHLFTMVIKDLGTMFTWFHDEGYGVDIDNLRQEHSGLMNFSTWLETDSAWTSPSK